MADNVNHPAHYTDGKYETIEFIERHGLSFHEGNAVKYISRAGKKDPDKTVEDLEKALWYVKRGSNTEDYLPDAITVHDYIIDKKLSPALASAISLIIASQYEDAEKMLEAEIERLKNEEKEQKTKNVINVDTSGYANAIDTLRNGFMKLSPKDHEFCKMPYFGKVICVISSDKNLLTPGKAYQVFGDRMFVNNHDMVMFDKPVYCVEQVNGQFNGKDKPIASFIEFKGEA